MGLIDTGNQINFNELKNAKSQETAQKVLLTVHQKEPGHDPDNCETCIEINMERVNLLALDATYDGIIARTNISST
ncbi:MAG: hypothetical protein NTY75_03285 [Candidatus Shapirobacteria bacterium]|nr:hypothetical protein [Candidatus Shapirobacteria bacterium]